MTSSPTTVTDAVAVQLRDELSGIAGPVAAILDPALVLDVERRIAAAAPLLAWQLVQDDDDRLAAQTCIDVMCALWPHGAPEDVGRADWWRSPLGRACARSLGRDDSEAVSHSVAAAMLGVHRGTVAQMVARGTLDRHPDGGVLRASVLQRLSRT